MIQSHIKQYIESKTRDNFPRSLLIIGEKGCGKSEAIQLISSKLKLVELDITEQINLDYIISMYEKPEPYLYVIDGTKITIKEQNMLLKIVEEPLKNAFIIIKCEASNQILNTIYNRCQKLIFNPFTKEELSQFCDDPFILELAKTPGQITAFKNSPIKDIIELCEKIIDKIGSANISNVLTIGDKLAFKQEKDKFDVDIFSSILIYSLNKRIHQSQELKYFDLYKLVSQWNIDRKAPTVLQQNLFENYLVKMYQLMRG